MTGSFQELRVWQNGMRLSLEIYRATKGFPKDELYGLTSQLRRAAISVPNNIAEGKGYKSNKDLLRFLYMARGSCLEVQSELIIAGQLEYLSKDAAQKLLDDAAVVGRELNAMIAVFERRVSAKAAGA